MKERTKNLLIIQNDLREGNFHTSPYRFFSRREGPKIRDLAALPFNPDRIAQWAVMLQTREHFERRLIDQTYAALPGRGHHKAHYKLKEYLKDPRTRYCLKVDFHHYFESIDKDILFGKVKDIFKDPMVLSYYEEVIYSYPKPGIPLGNLTSQILANIYLSDFDHFFKEKYHCKWYIRYMDDIIVLGWDKRWLHRVRRKMKLMAKELKLEINPSWQVFSVDDRGVDFAGYRTYRTYDLLRTRVKNNMVRKVSFISVKLENPAYTWDESDLSVLASYKGILSHCDSYRLSQKYLNPVLTSLRVRQINESNIR